MNVSSTNNEKDSSLRLIVKVREANDVPGILQFYFVEEMIGIAIGYVNGMVNVVRHHRPNYKIDPVHATNITRADDITVFFIVSPFANR